MLFFLSSPNPAFKYASEKKIYITLVAFYALKGTIYNIYGKIYVYRIRKTKIINGV